MLVATNVGHHNIDQTIGERLYTEFYVMGDNPHGHLNGQITVGFPLFIIITNCFIMGKRPKNNQTRF